MQQDRMHECICGHCGSRAFRIPIGTDALALECRYCGKVTVFEALVGETTSDAGSTGCASNDVRSVA